MSTPSKHLCILKRPAELIEGKKIENYGRTKICTTTNISKNAIKFPIEINLKKMKKKLIKRKKKDNDTKIIKKKKVEKKKCEKKPIIKNKIKFKEMKKDKSKNKIIKKVISQINLKNKPKKINSNLNTNKLNQTNFNKFKEISKNKIKLNNINERVKTKLKKKKSVSESEKIEKYEKMKKQYKQIQESLKKNNTKNDKTKLILLRKKINILLDEIDGKNINEQKNKNLKKWKKKKKIKFIENTKKPDIKPLALNMDKISVYNKEIQKNTITNKSSRLINSSICTNRYKEFINEGVKQFDDLSDHFKIMQEKLISNNVDENKKYNIIFKEIDIKMQENKKKLKLNLKNKILNKNSKLKNFNFNDNINSKNTDTENNNKIIVENTNNSNSISDDNIKITNKFHEVDSKIKKFQIVTENSLENSSNFSFKNKEIDKIFGKTNNYPNNNDINQLNIFKKVEKVNDYIMNFLIDDLFNEFLYTPEYILKFNRNEDDDNISESETVYGIRTNLNAVNEYCVLLLRFIVENHLNNIIDNINDYEFNKDVHIEIKFVKLRNRINNTINIENLEEKCWINNTNKNNFWDKEYFLKLEDTILSNYQNMNIIDELFNMQRIYHRCIFDCFNDLFTELIFSFTPKIKIYTMITNPCYKIKRKKFKQIDINNYLHSCSNSLIELSTYLCGIIKDKEDSIMGNVKFLEDSVINQIREEKLNRLLTNDILSSDNSWNLYDHEKIMINYEIANYIEDILVDNLLNNFF